MRFIPVCVNLPLYEYGDFCLLNLEEVTSFIIRFEIIVLVGTNTIYWDADKFSISMDCSLCDSYNI